ncbi:RBBP8 N-terminal-like protein isoform X2 [Rana temporaria]|uniref:RBBP8 N-terminal-like protein isoform X2 n=1 Tax=Rana temporaria TaxID=8407 RepID=UPI001AAC7818|nr:RBBP8 N-terminal-like protein isoform X2 [Rana temporaria]
MANENFSEALHKLKDIHDKEVLGMQAKLSEMTVEKCRDTQRLEELFSKNHILREQHKILNENIKVLENRLRAGLCDRCTVTQELAKKKQQEYETCHFHNLQQISSLTNQFNLLKEENKSLYEELRKNRRLDEKNRSRSHSPESNATSQSPHSEVPAANLKNNPEQHITQTSKDGEAQENVSDHKASEETSPTVLTLSPVLKNTHMTNNETRNIDLTMSGVQKVLLTTHNQQRISNQLHGTIAVMRPGVKCGQSGASSPIHRHSSANDVHPKENRTDLPEPPSPLDALKHVIPEEQLNLLRHHFIQRRLAQRNQGMPSDGPVRYVMAKNREPPVERKRSDDDWEEKAAMAELQGAMLYMREQGYKNRMSLTNQRDKLQYSTAKQNQELRSPSSPTDGPKYLMRESPAEKELSLMQALSTHWKNNRHQEEEKKDWSHKEDKCAEPEKRVHSEEDVMPDKPLDLSDTRRGYYSSQSDVNREPKGHYESHTANLSSRNKDSPPNRASVLDHGVRTEDFMLVANSERERVTEQDLMKHNMSTEVTRELLPIMKRPGKGKKRHRESDEEEEGQATDGNSPHRDMDEDLDTSDSEGEIERSQQSQAETSRGNYPSERNHSRWKKRLSHASRKCLRKQKKVLEHPAESDISQDDNVACKDLDRERPA